MTDWSYDTWESVGESGWQLGTRPSSEWDIDAHVDLGCGKIKKGRIGIDRYPNPGVNVLLDANALYGPRALGLAESPNTDAAIEVSQWAEPDYLYGLPFEDSSIKSIISHHFFEHVGDNFIRLVEECYRVLEPGGVLRVITPLFPSTSAVEDPDHKRYFMEDSWNFCCGKPGEGGHWHESFATPYTTARFAEIEKELTPQTEEPWSPADAREIRVSLRAEK